jgi:hypothetical protein
MKGGIRFLGSDYVTAQSMDSRFSLLPGGGRLALLQLCNALSRMTTTIGAMSTCVTGSDAVGYVAIHPIFISDQDLDDLYHICIHDT